MKIAISEFVRRQTPESQFSHWTCSDECLINLVTNNFDLRKPGYRAGVCLVPVPVGVFYCGLVVVKEGTKFIGVYESRQPGELPRKSSFAVTDEGKLPAKSCDIVLYSHAVLAENNEQSCDADWEIISVNASPFEGEMPMSVGTLLANHFHVEGSNDGGTSTKMTNDEFVAALKASYAFWKDKALIAPPALRERFGL